MAQTRIISIIGKKNSGKTTLAVALASEYVRKGRRVMSIKHASHPVDVDRPGSDSYRHFHEGKAERVLVVSPGMRTLFKRSPEESDAIDLARLYFEGADIVIVEGFKNTAIPKIEVFRREASTTPLFDPSAGNADQWVAVVTDDEKFEANCPVLRFRDTMWLQLLANIGWEKARLL